MIEIEKLRLDRFESAREAAYGRGWPADRAEGRRLLRLRIRVLPGNRRRTKAITCLKVRQARRVFVDPRSFRLLDGTVLGYDTEPDQPRLSLRKPARQEHVWLRHLFQCVDAHSASPTGSSGEDHQ